MRSSKWVRLLLSRAGIYRLSRSQRFVDSHEPAYLTSASRISVVVKFEMSHSAFVLTSGSGFAYGTIGACAFETKNFDVSSACLPRLPLDWLHSHSRLSILATVLAIGHMDMLRLRFPPPHEINLSRQRRIQGTSSKGAI